jgi:hypothetical protein
MKQCDKCKEQKNKDLFYKHKNKKDGLSPICKVCQSKYDNKNYQNNKDVIKQNVIKNKKDKKEWYESLKQNIKCLKCKDKRSYVIDYHHIDPTQKSFTISDYMKYSKKDILNEINKCIPLCRNCHQEFHHFEKNKNITVDEYIA